MKRLDCVPFLLERFEGIAKHLIRSWEIDTNILATFTVHFGNGQIYQKKKNLHLNSELYDYVERLDNKSTNVCFLISSLF